MSVEYQLVIAKIEHTGYSPITGPNSTNKKWLILRKGLSDFSNDGKFNATNEKVIILLPAKRICPHRISQVETFWDDTDGTEANHDYTLTQPV